MRGQFDPKPPTVNTDGVEVEHPPFLSQAKVSLLLVQFYWAGGHFRNEAANVSVTYSVECDVMTSGRSRISWIGRQHIILPKSV